MANHVISVEGLSKRYVLGEQQHDTLRDQLAHKARGLVSALRGRSLEESTPGEFWALRDIGFSVQQGEVLGVIGRNGAGKSTLLKILSRITEPTRGSIRIRGRVASLLEVGTGFHPELTGRDNIFLNGALLGMRRDEIRKKFDAIVSFAEVEKFLDTPVKRYSSGMYVRLAFAVAAHLEPDILIVDEVLAVGDAAFQQKCLGKMNEVASSGRTILFVSHNMVSVQQLCTRAIRLVEGRLDGDGSPLEQIHLYMGNLVKSAERVIRLEDRPRRLDPAGGARFVSAELQTGNPQLAWQLPFRTPLVLEFHLQVNRRLPSFEVGIAVSNLQGQEIVSTLSSWQGDNGALDPGAVRVRADLGVIDLTPGVYRVGVGIKGEHGLEDYIPEAFDVEVIPSADSRLANLVHVRGAIARQARFEFSRP